MTSPAATPVPDSDTTRPARRTPFQTGAAVALFLVAAVTFLLMPTARHKWPNVAMFVPAYQAILIGTYLLVSYLIYGYFLQTRIRSMLWLWSGCIYTAGILLAQFLSLPGAFVAGKRLLGGDQTTIWLWFFWHLGAGSMLLGYSVTEWRAAGRIETNPGMSIARTGLVTALVLTVTLVVVTMLHDHLPVQDVGGDYSRVNASSYGTLLQLILFAALFFLWRATRLATPISAWLAVAILALAFDNLITLAGGARLSIGWYVGRLNALFSALVMLVLYMQIIHRTYLKATANTNELELAKAALEFHQERLESLVRERTRSLEDAQNALLHAQKLEAIGKLTGGVAHDFNNVLHIISGNLDLIRMLSGTNYKILQRYESARNAVQRGARLSTQLLAFARKQPLQPTPTDMGKLLANMDELVKRAVGDQVEIVLTVAPQVWNTMVDRQQLENLILNLALNARDAMPQGGRFLIDLCSVVLEQANAAPLGLSGGDYVRLRFTDNGSGMSATVRERAFEPFFSTKGVGKGTGLGLSMAYGFVKQSGGHIEIESAPGQGTSVTILLPRTAGAAVDKQSAPRLAMTGGSETILVVDDEVAIQENVAEILSNLGYHVLKAGSADEAEALLHEHKNIDLLFTDVMMPGSMNGPQLASVARRLRPAIRVLFSSGYSADAILQGGEAQGMNLLNKPYRDDELASAVRTILN